MTAKPIISQRLYRLTGNGLNLIVAVTHGFDAICIGLLLLERRLEQKGQTA